MSTIELLAIIIRSGREGATAIDLAQQLLRAARNDDPRVDERGELRQLSRLTAKELDKVSGIGLAKAAQVSAALEIGVRLAQEKGIEVGEAFRSSHAVFERYRARFRDVRKESFLALLLDTKNRLIREYTVSEGTLSSSLVHPREVFNPAIRDAAHAIIVVHNHPTGDPTPSPEDREITSRLKQAAEVIGIKLLDHIIIGDETYKSFADEGWL